MKITIFSTQNQNAHMSTYQALRTKTKIFIFVKIEIVNIFILNLLKKTCKLHIMLVNQFLG